jgi:hypothetical protein
MTIIKLNNTEITAVFGGDAASEVSNDEGVFTLILANTFGLLGALGSIVYFRLHKNKTILPLTKDHRMNIGRASCLVFLTFSLGCLGGTAFGEGLKHTLIYIRNKISADENKAS